VRLVFLGTSSFACPALTTLADGHDIALVVTQPDRPVGRHAELRPPPIKVEADRLDLTVFQPERINAEDSVDRLRDAGPDALVVAAYGQLLKSSVFALASLGTINIHASLLPAYRGAAPVNWAIIRGETTTGITTFLIDAGMDTGDILLQQELHIDPSETAGRLEERLARLGAEVIIETIADLEGGALTPRPQPEEGVSLAPRLSRDDGRIDWTSPARRVHDLVRGTNPWPGAWALLDGERVKIHRTSLTDVASGQLSPGQIGLRETDRLLVGTDDQLIEIDEIQREGRPRIGGPDFLHGLHAPARFT
jgi:methionyl-tRNA formyltransferase